MGFWKDFGLGFNTYGKAISLIFKKGLWWFFFFPIVINILLFWGGLEGIGILIDWLNAVGSTPSKVADRTCTVCDAGMYQTQNAFEGTACTNHISCAAGKYAINNNGIKLSNAR
jgi:hypothetical protein